MDFEDRSNYFLVNSAEELLNALKRKESYILIQGDFKKEFEQNTQLPLSETEKMPFELGFSGSAGLWGEIFYQIINVFGKGEKQQKKIDSQVRKYNMKKINENELLLYLRQLDY